MCPTSLNRSSENAAICPIFPTLTLYILGTADEHYRQTSRLTVWLDIGLESASDVHLRNALILQTYPQYHAKKVGNTFNPFEQLPSPSPRTTSFAGFRNIKTIAETTVLAEILAGDGDEDFGCEGIIDPDRLDG